MSFLDDFIGYFILLGMIALVCSSIFWGLASGALAINAQSKRPLLHLLLGALLQFVWFFVVGVLAIVAIVKGKSNQNVPNQAQPQTATIVTPDANKGFEEW
jgi:hypothetical protein